MKYVDSNFKISLEEKEFIQRVKSYYLSKLKQLDSVLEVHLLGSVSRQTFVKKPYDFDFFLFYEDLSTFDIEVFFKQVQELFYIDPSRDLLLGLEHSVSAKIEPKNRGFPYLKLITTFESRKINIDIVPCKKNAAVFGDVDRTKLHEEFLQACLTEDLKIEIRKLKYLLKRTGLYGADSDIKGFSGYCCEVLIWNYKKIALIEPNLDILKDPVDPFRNLLASVSESNRRRFDFLNAHNFKNPNRLLSSDEKTNVKLYKWENAPLKMYSILQKEKNVYSVVKIGKDLILELKDDYKKIPIDKVDYNSSAFIEKPFHSIYFSLKDGVYKKISSEVVLKKYSNIKPINYLENKKDYKSYFYFK